MTSPEEWAEQAMQSAVGSDPYEIVTGQPPVTRIDSTAEPGSGRLRPCGTEHYFCEDYGCGSLEDLAQQIRQRAEPEPEARPA